jgi:hypothetical protein
MGYRIVAASWRELGTPSAYEARTPAEALSKVRGLRSLGCELTITGPDGEFVSQRDLESRSVFASAALRRHVGTIVRGELIWLLTQTAVIVVIGVGAFALAAHLLARF